MNPYEKLKQRDFSSDPFEVTCSPDCRLHYVKSEEPAVLQTRRGRKNNADGKDEAATAIVKGNMKMSNVQLARLLTDTRIKRSHEWVRKSKFDIVQEAGGTMP